MVSGGLLNKTPGESSSPLYFQSPLKGKFEITAGVSLHKAGQVWLDYGGYAAIPKEKGSRERIAAEGASTQKSKKKVPHLNSIVRYRIAVDDKVIETYVNDIRVGRHEFKEAPRPWFTLTSSSSRGRPIVQNLRITGQPEIPTEIDLLAADGLAWSGGISRYKEEDEEDQNRYRTRATPVDKWILKNGEVTSGSLTEDFQPTLVYDESHIAYDRPMLEDGEFEFEMFVDAEKKKMCHVAIGRTALLLKQDGAWRHEIGGDSDFDSPQDEKVKDSKSIDLKDGDWNQVLLRLVGDKATLLVNDTEVASIDVVDAKTLRFPGLFRFSDQSNAQVRNVRLRGNWPTSLPDVNQQELAQTSNDLLADRVAGETKDYDFSQSIDQLKAAGLNIKEEAQIETTDGGLKITARKFSDKKKWPTFQLPINSPSDFDVSIKFADLSIRKATGWGCNFDLQVDFDDAEKTEIAIGIKRDKANDLFVLAQRASDRPHGKRHYDSIQLFQPFAEGSLRLVRHAGELYCLATAEGKPQQLIGSFVVGERIASGVSIVAKSAKDTAKLDCILKKMSVKVTQ